jgi:hypothetical protein
VSYSIRQAINVNWCVTTRFSDTGNALHRINAYELVRRRAAAAGIKTRISNHSFRAPGITVSEAGRLA